MPDRELAESVVAFVVLAGDNKLDGDSLEQHCLTHLARFKRPKHYRVLDALPKNNYGKVLKRVLRESITDKD